MFDVSVNICVAYYVCNFDPSRIHAGDEGANINDSNWSMDCSTVLRVKTLHISSPILAAKSPFFYKVICFYDFGNCLDFYAF